MSRYIYRVQDVVGDLRSNEIPTILRRSFVEQSFLRYVLKSFFSDKRAKNSVDFGSGFGRMLGVLQEFTECDVYAVERESELINISTSLNPDVRHIQVDSLSEGETDLTDGCINLLMTWTVLQHLHSDELLGAIHEIKRITAKYSIVVLCEETEYQGNRNASKEDHICIGRPVEEYQELMESHFDFVGVYNRPKERTNSRCVGNLMVFKKR